MKPYGESVTGSLPDGMKKKQKIENFTLFLLFICVFLGFCLYNEIHQEENRKGERDE